MFIIELLLELVYAFIHAFIGALVGVLWPPQAAAWARWQMAGIGSAVLSVIGFAITFSLAGEGWTPLVWFLFGLACLLAACYLVIGNMCRRFHEAARRNEKNPTREAKSDEEAFSVRGTSD